MRRVRILLALLALVLAAATPASATTVTVVMTGTWYSVDDTASVLGGSVSAGDSFTATLVYDDTTPDSDASVDIGAYLVPAVSSDLSVATGAFSFAPSSGVDIGVENDNSFGEDWTYLHAEDYVGSGPFSGGTGFGTTAYADASLTSFAGTAHSSDDLIGLNWNLGDFDANDFYLFVEVTGHGPLQYVEFAGTLESIALLPEPTVSALLILGCAALVARRVRG